MRLTLQEMIHRLEVGSGKRYLRIGLTVLAVVLFTVTYNWRAYRNMASQEAMDSAQLARNLAQGKGYTTFFVRPFSMYLLKERYQTTHGIAEAGPAVDATRIRGMHPDISNPPVYPVVLAGLMKVFKFEYGIPSKPKPFWSHDRKFWRYQPDFIISMFNQALFFGAIVLVFLLARRLFDTPVAWLSAALLLGTELFWRFSVSGLSTMLLLVIFLGLVWCLVLLEAEMREPKRGRAGALVLAGLAGLTVAVGCLTRYSFGWLILPVALFAVLFANRDRLLIGVTALIVFAAVLSPWAIRNYSLSGSFFGTATFAAAESSMVFPEHTLERSLNPDLNRVPLRVLWYKLAANARQIVQNDLPKLGGSWVSAFFLVGLLVSFRNPAVQRLRYFLLAALLVLTVVQCMGRTQLSEDVPEVNSENLLVLLAPLVLVLGVSLFFLLLEQAAFPFPELRFLAIGVFAAIACLPLLLTFLPPRSLPVVYPPYYPPLIQRAAGYIKEDELTMSDIPWAMAWYGQSQSVWLTLDPQDDFFQINDYQKPVQELFLARPKTEALPLHRWILAGEQTWDSLVLQVLQRIPPLLADDRRWEKWPKEVSLRVRQDNGQNTLFPLKYWQLGSQFDMLLLTARPHFPKSDQ